MVGEKDTDPRVRDGQTDAWKRDGEQQTKKDSHLKAFDAKSRQTPKKASPSLNSEQRKTDKQ